MWSRLVNLVRDRLLLARLAGAAFWIGWLVGLAIGGWGHDVRGHRVGADHVQFYVAGQLVNEGRADRLYDAEVMSRRQGEIGGAGWRGFLPFRYPPFYALCFALTSRLPYEASWLVWTGLGLALWVASGWLLGVPWRAWLGWSACFFPVFAAISFGQNSMISLAILSAAAALWLGQRPLAAGLVAGLLAFKPQLAVGLGLLWLCDARRSWPALLGMAATALSVAALGWLAVPEAYRAFADSLQQNAASQDRLSLHWHMGSQGFWQLLLPGWDGAVRIASLATSGAGLGVFVALVWRRRGRQTASLAVALLLTPWLTPYILVYDWALLLIPAVLFWRTAGATGERERWLVLAAALWLVALTAGPLVLGQLYLSPVALHPALPALVAVVLLLGRMKDEESTGGGLPPLARMPGAK